MTPAAYDVVCLAAGPAAAQCRVVVDDRGTAPALIRAARWAVSQDPKAIVLQTPSGSSLAALSGWRPAVATAAELAVRGFLVLLGVADASDSPAASRWAIRPGRPLHAFGHHVDALIAAPPSMPAATWPPAGALGHSGAFVWRARTFLATAAPDPGHGAVERTLLQPAPERLAVVALAAAANVSAR